MVKDLNAELQNSETTTKKNQPSTRKNGKVVTRVGMIYSVNYCFFLNKRTCKNKNDKDNEKYPIRFSENGEMV